MNDKMIRFLKSIGIEDIDRFDLDFELVARNANNRDRVDMFIIKKTPWNSRLLEEFMNGLNTISYQYMMRFSYETKPNADDAAKLFDDWFFSHNRYRTEAKCVGEDGKVTFYYKGEEEKNSGAQAEIDFEEFLKEKEKETDDDLRLITTIATAMSYTCYLNSCFVKTEVTSDIVNK